MENFGAIAFALGASVLLLAGVLWAVRRALRSELFRPTPTPLPNFPEYLVDIHERPLDTPTEEPDMATKKKAKKKVAKKTKARSAKTGKYVSKQYARKHKATTVVET